MISIEELKKTISNIINYGDIDIDFDDLNETSIMICDMINCMDDTLNVIPEEILMCINTLFEETEDLLTELIEGDENVDEDIIIPTAVGLTKLPENIIKNLYNNIVNNDYENEMGIPSEDILIERVIALSNLPKSEQKSDAWLEERTKMVTASELATVVGIKSFFKNKRELMVNKANPSKGWSSTAMDHGNRYEEVVCRIYQKRTGVKVNEYGLIKHQGGNGIEPLKLVGASPDGINTFGRMLEIKVPLSRVITGVISPCYYAQVQSQMECCNLWKCDFVECTIKEYFNENEFKEDHMEDIDESDERYSYLTANNLEKGLVLVIYKRTGVEHYYPGVHISYERALKRIEKRKKKMIDKDKKYEIDSFKIIYWRVEVYSQITIDRSPNWFVRNYHHIEKFWKEMRYLKETQQLRPPPPVHKTTESVGVCLID